MSNQNPAGVQNVYHAFAKGDIPTVLGFLSPDIAWTEAEGFPYGGTYNGPNAVLEKLIAAGADLKAKNKQGQTALDLARNYNHAKAASLLTTKIASR